MINTRHIFCWLNYPLASRKPLKDAESGVKCGKSKMAIACVSFATSNVILMITGALSLPLYFSFYGSQAAIRFSLLLCIHSCILAAIPKVLVSKLMQCSRSSCKRTLLGREKKASLTGAGRLRECENTEFVWELNKTGF